ncbi:hypothetical protein CspeluHIS016_0802640 [Cutaneotrichosporon spelunceum]|uniref:DNA-binding protein REB1 n=1 Tax=Cutaneotrichosporon spelunceum TaxID=1672016 RepID=A0AAD3TZK2_9TREE|nr:hypothetical protein CspeluHIS016_0802640 [Cutaneotrichosporon spelunceum]
MSRTPAPSGASPGPHTPKTPQRYGKRNRSRATTLDLASSVSPSGFELSRIDNALAPSPDATPLPRRHQYKSKWAERKSTLSNEFIDDSSEEEADEPKVADVRLERVALQEESGAGSEAESEQELPPYPPTDPIKLPPSTMPPGAFEDEVSSEDTETYSDDELPAYPPTEPIKPPPCTMPLVAVSQVSDLPDIVQVKGKRRHRMTDAEYEIFLRKQVASKEDAEELLSSRWLSPDDIRRLEATGLITIMRGKFLEAEKRAMREHLTTFQAVHKMSDQDLVDLIMSKGRFVERSPYPTFWYELAAEVPGRPVKSVVEATKRMYDPRARKGLWLPSEDRALLKAQDMFPNSWTRISEAVDRSEHDCRDRWRELRDVRTRAVGPWSAEEETALRKAVAAACAAAGRDPADGVPWDDVVERMGRKRTAMQCRQKWKGRLVSGSYTSPGPHNARLDRRRMIRRLREMAYDHEADIKWTDVTQGWAVRPALLKNTWSLLRRRVSTERSEMPLSDLLDKIEAGLDAVDAAIGESGASRSATKRAATTLSRAKRMKTKAAN